jgi:hypothetical protein
MEEFEKDWKLKLQYEKIVTPYKHYTIIAEGNTDNLIEDFTCPKGNAFMGMKIWAESLDESSDVFQNISRQIGFKITGNLQIYETEPQEPPRENPYGYGINFNSFDE